MTPLGVATALWVIWALSWLVAAIWSSRPHSRAGLISQLPYRLITTAGFVLLFGFGRTDRHFVSLPQWVGWILTILTAVGFGLAWWARLHLGKLWSAFVTRKDEHRVIETGPYGIVRHPGYAGLILVPPFSGLALGSWIAVAVGLVMSVLVVRRVLFEDSFLRKHLEGYTAYAQRVPHRLIPGVW